MRTCKHEGCPRPVKGKGYCATHYMQWRNRGFTTDILNTVLRKPDEEFIKREQERVAGIEQRKRDRQGNRAKRGVCVAPGCEKISHVAKTQECSGHYQQRLSGREYSPLIEWSPRQDAKSESRRCNTCSRIKRTKEDFYLRRNQKTPQNECKVCAKFRSRSNRLFKEGRTEEATGVKAEWDAYIASGASEQG